MPTITLKSKYKIDFTPLLSPEELKDIYLFGIPLTDKNGVSISDETIKYYIAAAQEQLENYLALKFKKQVYVETLSFTAEHFYNWAYLRVTYPVVYPILLEGFLNTTKQTTYPKEWLSCKTSIDGTLYHRNLYIVPAGNSSQLTQQQLFTGIIPNLSYLGLARIPNYWSVTYISGFAVVPRQLIDIVGKLAALNIFRISGDLVVSAGIGSFSLSIDGLSQSQSIKAFDSRIQATLTDLTQRLLPEARDYYKGILFSVC